MSMDMGRPAGRHCVTRASSEEPSLPSAPGVPYPSESLMGCTIAKLYRGGVALGWTAASGFGGGRASLAIGLRGGG